MLISMLSGVSLMASASEGTEADPIIIMSQADFEEIGNAPGLYYKLGKNIILESDYVSISDFAGTLDGNGNAVYLKETKNGLFSSTTAKSVIKNVVTYGSVSGAGNLGAIAGKNSGKIINCVNNANVTSTGSYVGGISGNNSGQISGCVNNGNVETTGSHIGGVAGYILKASIDTSANTGNVKGASNAAGIVGQTAGAGNTVTNCYNRGNIKTTNGQSGGRGVAGITASSLSGGDSITSCYNAGTVFHASNDYTATNAIYGTGTKTGITISGCFYLSETASADKTSDGVDSFDALNLNSEAMSSKSTFSTWDFSNTWEMGTGDYLYPVLKGDKTVSMKTDGFVLEIASQEDFNLIATYPEFSYKVVADFTLDNHTPIANLKNEFDGNGKTITFKNATAGLFTTVDAGVTVKNVVTDGEITSTDSAGIIGAIAGINKGNIETCINNAEIKGTTYIAGIAGKNSGIITDSYNNGIIDASGQFAGGIAGYNQNEIINCGNTALVKSSSNYVGGIAGYAQDSSVPSIDKCYNTGNIEGKNRVGGILGSGAGSTTISNTFNTGTITAGSGNNMVGGIIGGSTSGLDSVSESYNIGKIIRGTTNLSVNYSIIGSVNTTVTNVVSVNNCYYLGNEAAEVEKVSFTGGGYLDELSLRDKNSFKDWNFSDIWEMGKTDGYKLPVLKDLTFSYSLEAGTTLNPYIIKDEADLAKISDDLDGYYEIANDVEIVNVTTTLNISNFAGVFDGKGKTINFENTENGLFISVGANGVVKNLKTTGSIVSEDKSGTIGAIAGTNKGTIEGCINGTSIKGTTKIGGIAGINAGMIKASYNNATVEASGQFVGGITGHNQKLIEKCGNTASVSSSNAYAGGIAGYAQKSGVTTEIIACYNTGSISASGRAAGILGSGAGSNSISDCFNAGTVTVDDGAFYAGILGGSNSGTDSVSNSYNIGKIYRKTNENSVNNAIIGVNNNSDAATLTLTNCYYLGNVNAEAKEGVNVVGGGNLDEASIRNQNSFKNWDFEKLWEMGDKDGYKLPILKDVIFSYSVEEGTALNPVIIKTADEFKNLKGEAGKFYELGANIDLGDDYTPVIFEGNLNGNGNSVTFELNYGVEDNAENVGLFSELTGVYEIKNLILHGSINIDATYESDAVKRRIGSLAGNITGSGNIINVTSDVDINAKYTSHIGGIIGYASDKGMTGKSIFENLTYNGTINSVNGANTAGIVATTKNNVTVKKCVNNGNISGNGTVSGIVGWAYGDIFSCYNTGDITAESSQASGISARIYGTVNVENCYNTGDIKAAVAPAGGIVAEAMSKDSLSVISNCYNLGSVVAAEEKADGIIAVPLKATVENSYYLSKTQGIYGTAKTLSEMKELKASDLGDAYEDKEGYSYPKLKGLTPDEDVVIYDISVEESVNGIVKADKDYAKENTKVTLTAIPSEYYVLTSIKAGESEIVSDESGKAEFVIISDIVISASFAEDTSEPSAPVMFTTYSGDINAENITGISVSEQLTMIGRKVIPAFSKVAKGNLSYKLVDYGFVVSYKNDAPAVGEAYCYTASAYKEGKLASAMLIFGAPVEETTEGTTWFVIPYATYNTEEGTKTIYGTVSEIEPKIIVE